MAHDVFISYSHKDKAVADAICASLESRGIRCWYAPRNIRTGETWAGAIPKAIEEAGIFILVFTDHANASGQVVREVNIAVSSGATIIPYRLTRSEPTGDMSYYLGPVHWLDAINEKQTRAIEALARRCEAILAGRPFEEVIEDHGRRIEWKRALIAVCLIAAVAAVTALIVTRAGKPVPRDDAAQVTQADADEVDEMSPVFDDSMSCFPSLEVGLGDIVTFGHYYLTDDETPEEITWRVLERDEDSMLLMSELALENHNFSETEDRVTWETSEMRRWLNRDFKNQIFTAAEQACIMDSKVTADANPRPGSDQGNDTTDKLYLLSVSEVDHYFASDSERRIRPTQRVKKANKGNRIVDPYNNTVFWWLRTMSEDNHLTCYVAPSGTYISYGENGYTTSFCVVPVVRVNIYSIITASGLVER